MQSNYQNTINMQLGGKHLKKFFGGISCEKSRFYAKQSYFFQILGRGAPGASTGSAPDMVDDESMITTLKWLSSHPESILCESVVWKSLSCSHPSEICNSKLLTFFSRVLIYLMIDYQSNMYCILIDILLFNSQWTLFQLHPWRELTRGTWITISSCLLDEVPY